jgi:filamentous hemagglutinin
LGEFWANAASTLAAGAVEAAGNVAIGAEELGTEGLATPAVPAEEAGLAGLAGEAGSAAAGAVDSGGTKALEAAADSVWRLNPIQRGIAIEKRLAATEYADWYWVGQERNGFFPLVDFQQGDTLVSLRTVDTNGVSWFDRTMDHIIELRNNGATVDGKLAQMKLDLRVQPGGLEDAEPLAEFGKSKGIIVRIEEFL